MTITNLPTGAEGSPNVPVGSRLLAAPRIKMPILTMLNPDTGSRVTLMGTCHAAQPAYYAEIDRRLTVLEKAGASVFYEQVTDSEADIEAAAPGLRKGARLVRRSIGAELLRAKSLGLTLQTEQLPPRVSWERHDLGLIDVAAFYGTHELGERGRRARMWDLTAGFSPSVKRALLLETLTALAEVVTGRAAREAVFVGVDWRLAARREAHALAAVDLHLAREPGRGLVLLWAAAHLPGFCAGLDTRGYKTESEEWVVAIDPATLPNLESDPR